MKDKEEFLKQMENLKVPQINPAEHQKSVKMAIMNAERSAVLGVWLIVVPCYFLLCVYIYYLFHLRGSWFGAMFTLMANFGKAPYLDLLGPVLLFVLPLVCIVINTLAIIHVQVLRPWPDKPKAKEVSFTIKIKLWNILLILVSVIIVFVFLNYVMTENISIKN